MAAAPVDLSKIEFPSPFYGDDRDAENGFPFLRELQKAGIIYDDAAHAKVIRIWALTLEGEASAWWNDATIWNGKDRTKIDTVVAEFEKKWPAPSASPKKQHEKMAEFSAVTLNDEEVERKFIDNQGAESTRHVSFIKELMKKAYAAGDSNVKNLMLPQAIARIPPRLAKAIGDSCVDIQSWDELLTKTEAVSRARIEQVIAEEKKRKDLEERLLKVEGKTPEPAPAPVNNPIDTSERHSAAYSPRPYGAGRFPFIASPARASPRPQTPRPTPPSQSLSDPIAEATPRPRPLPTKPSSSHTRIRFRAGGSMRRLSAIGTRSGAQICFPRQRALIPCNPGALTSR
ncbi:hypothetical protein B0H11DRAFT_1331395 [Mycena galericulata]|nr:hypothetical protein B0H11DRAFT_1331395 [Mycena galericulata]